MQNQQSNQQARLRKLYEDKFQQLQKAKQGDNPLLVLILEAEARALRAELKQTSPC